MPRDTVSTRISAPDIRRMKRKGRRIVALTAYDAAFARLLDDHADVLLVGDSVGMVVQGCATTLGVTLEQMIYHAQAVVRGSTRAHVVADMPFMSYQTCIEDGIRSAGRLIKEGGAQSVKLEGGQSQAVLIERLTSIGIPVMGHIGLTPQSIHQLGGYKMQGRSDAAARQLLEDATVLEQAGAYAIVLESMPSDLARRLTTSLSIPTIGIGAGPECDGQVLVLYDMLGMDRDFLPRFAKRYAELADAVEHAAREYRREVQAGEFPAAAHSWQRPNETMQRSGQTSDRAGVEGESDRAGVEEENVK